MIYGGRAWYSAGAGIALSPLFFVVASACGEYGGAGLWSRILGVSGACLAAVLLFYAAGSRRKWIRWTALLLMIAPPLAIVGLVVWALHSLDI